MSTYKKFEDLEVWKMSRELCYALHLACQKKEVPNSGYLINHLYKTAGSIMDNIAEGFERGGNKELLQFLYIAKGSSGEFRSQVYRALDLDVFSQDQFDGLIKKSVLISQQLGLFINYLKKSSYKGDKFKP
ncbi:four helix bundle protein [Lishizhenia tianjinensis]|uniref:Four helix bundle protein n=1 Tax=Lishizhenia tianjinensis TaxID=477690 RepID=A0A1I6ZVI7_9FLAO|nr:four helix bundle protein [Lishizhenia tianjinensis]SFT66699.1 four helix bundle protein [Lishizhenia tianjinensis]